MSAAVNVDIVFYRGISFKFTKVYTRFLIQQLQKRKEKTPINFREDTLFYAGAYSIGLKWIPKLDAYKCSGCLYNYGCLHIGEWDCAAEGLEKIEDSVFKI